MLQSFKFLITKTQFFVDVPIWESQNFRLGEHQDFERHFPPGFAWILNYKPSEIIDFSLLSLTLDEKFGISQLELEKNKMCWEIDF